MTPEVLLKSIVYGHGWGRAAHRIATRSVYTRAQFRVLNCQPGGRAEQIAAAQWSDLRRATSEDDSMSRR